MTRYEQGFLTKCAEYGVDGRFLLKKIGAPFGGTGHEAATLAKAKWMEDNFERRSKEPIKESFYSNILAPRMKVRDSLRVLLHGAGARPDDQIKDSDILMEARHNNSGVPDLGPLSEHGIEGGLLYDYAKPTQWANYNYNTMKHISPERLARMEGVGTGPNK